MCDKVFNFKVRQLKEIWDSEHLKISSFMTDDSAALRGALRTIWPSIPLLLCQYHVAAAVWNWLFTPKNEVPQAQRQVCMRLFKEIMYAPTLEKAQSFLDTCLQKCKNFISCQK
jgi:hypothetical protein